MKEKKLSIIFVTILALISIVNILIPEKKFSAKENRYLQQFPKLNIDEVFNGNFNTNFKKYTNDQFVLRDNWVALKTISDRLILKQDNNRGYFGKKGYLFEIKEIINSDQINKNIDFVNKFKKNIDEYTRNINLSAMLIPTKSSVLKKYLPPYAPIIDEDSLLKKIKDRLNNQINIINTMDILSKHSNEYIYYKTDHHWTSLGAYYAYKQFLRDESIKLDKFNVEQVANDFYGTIYRKANFYIDKPDTIEKYNLVNYNEINLLINEQIKKDSLYDPSYLNKIDKYSYFLGGDQAIIDINTNINNDKEILILKDSFANSMIPFLVNHYKNIHIIDTRYYNGSIKDYMKEKGINNVLLLYNIQNFVNEPSLYKLGR